MKPSITVFTPDEQVGQLLRLELGEAGYRVQIHTGAPSGAHDTLCFIDLDAYPDAPMRETDVGLTRRTSADARSHGTVLSLPFPIGAAVACVERRASSASPLLRMTEHGVVWKGRHIELTETEHALLRALIEADGATVSREALARCMRGGTSSEGAINVYIHYLRKKLEAGGERILLSTRGGGYRIDRRYLAPTNAST